MAAMPVTRRLERGVGDMVMMDIYKEYAAAVNEAPSKMKERLSALSKFTESQGLAGQAEFDGLRSLCSHLQAELSDAQNFAVFYRFVFFICRDRGQKSMSVSTAINGWRLALTGRFRLLDQWCAFVQVHQQDDITEDTWEQVLEFSRCVHEDLSNYNPVGAWPVLVDEFVDNMYRNNACSRCSKDTHRVCDCGVNAVMSLNTDASLGSSLNCQASTLPGIIAQPGSKRLWKDPNGEISQRLAKRPNPSITKHMRTSGNVLWEPCDPMEVDAEQGQGISEQRGILNVTNQFAQGSMFTGQTSTSGYDVFLSSSWQPWPSLGRIENCRWGRSNGPSNVQIAEVPTGCGCYAVFSSPQQDLLLHRELLVFLMLYSFNGLQLVQKGCKEVDQGMLK